MGQDWRDWRYSPCRSPLRATKTRRGIEGVRMILLAEFRPPADELAAFEKGKRAMSTTRLDLRVILNVGLLTVCGTAAPAEELGGVR